VLIGPLFLVSTVEFSGALLAGWKLAGSAHAARLRAVAN